jgi:hypothetical protein
MSESVHRQAEPDKGIGAILRSAPLGFKVWLFVAAILYLAAKIHTASTFEQPDFVQRHWPFWAAMLGWCLPLPVGIAVAGAVEVWRRRRGAKMRGTATDTTDDPTRGSSSYTPPTS